YRYRRCKDCPKLTEQQKIDRLNWCFENRFNNFENYIFVDETEFKLNLTPLYSHRRSSWTNSASVYRFRNQGFLNLWGGISFISRKGEWSDNFYYAIIPVFLIAIFLPV
ncbi:unnamed protein product, partial [Brachionus calyciflorus]